MTIETPDDVVALRRIGRIVSKTSRRMLDAAELHGYVAGTWGTIAVPPTKPQQIRLCHAARTTLGQALPCARSGGWPQRRDTARLRQSPIALQESQQLRLEHHLDQG